MFTVTQHYQIIEKLGLKDLSCKLVAICVISYFFKSIFNILYMYSNVRYDRVKNFRVGCKHGLRLYLDRGIKFWRVISGIRTHI